jgi:hypothetical protein
VNATRIKRVHRALYAITTSALALGLLACEQKPSAPVAEPASDRVVAEQASPRPPPIALEEKPAPAKSEASAKPPSAGRPVNDRELTVRVKSAVLREPLGALVFDVGVSGGVVTLHGTADTAATRDKAAKAASAVEGVKSVDNRIAILGGS